MLAIFSVSVAWNSFLLQICSWLEARIHLFNSLILSAMWERT